MTVIKMLGVFGLLGLTLWWLRRHDRSSLLSARRGEKPVALLAQSRVGKNSSIAVVRIGNAAYAVGVTEQSVTLLVPEPIELPELDGSGDTDTDSDAAADPDADTAAAPTPAALTAAVRPAPTVAGLLRGLTDRLHRPGRQVQYLPLDAALHVDEVAGESVVVPDARTESTPIDLSAAIAADTYAATAADTYAATAAPAPDGSAATPFARTPETLHRR